MRTIVGVVILAAVAAAAVFERGLGVAAMLDRIAAEMDWLVVYPADERLVERQVLPTGFRTPPGDLEGTYAAVLSFFDLALVRAGAWGPVHFVVPSPDPLCFRIGPPPPPRVEPVVVTSSLGRCALELTLPRRGAPPPEWVLTPRSRARLVAMLGEDEPLRRALAARLLGCLGPLDDAAVASLGRARHDPCNVVRLEAAAALARVTAVEASARRNA